MTQNLHSSIIINHSLLKITFILSDCPPKSSLAEYINLLQSHSCQDLIRISSVDSYDASVLVNAGITVYEMQFVDGSVPPPELVKRYFEVIDTLVSKKRCVVAIHCVSGIGRAPLLIAMLLVRSGMDRMDAIEFMRSKRRGAINKMQLDWILSKKGFQLKSGKLGIFGKMFARDR